MQEIAASAQEQAVGLQEVNTAVNQMDQMTQQNAAMVEQSIAASHSLARKAEQLAGVIGRFRIGDRPEAGKRGPESTRTNKPPIGRSPQLGNAALVSRRATGSFAVKPVPDPSDWEEF